MIWTKLAISYFWNVPGLISWTTSLILTPSVTSLYGHSHAVNSHVYFSSLDLYSELSYLMQNLIRALRITLRIWWNLQSFSKKQTKRKKETTLLSEGLWIPWSPSFRGPQIRICVLGEGWGGFKAYRHPFVGTMGWCCSLLMPERVGA